MEKKFNILWSEELSDAEVSDFGEVIVNISDLGDFEMKTDAVLAGILGWNEVPTDDDNDPFHVEGIVDDGYKMYVVFSMSRNFSLGHDYRCLASYVVSAEAEGHVQVWIKAQQDAAEAEMAKAHRIQELFEANGLDDKSVRRRREELLEEHGLNK